MQEPFERIGTVIFDLEDHTFANPIRQTLTREEISCIFQRVGLETLQEMVFCDFIAPLESKCMGGFGPT